MININKRQKILIRVMYFIRYFGDALFYSFLQLFLAYKGLKEGDIGFINSLRPFVVIICNPIWSLISGNVNTNRKIMRIITIIEGLLIAFISQSTGMIILSVFIVLLSLFDSPFYSFLDGYTCAYALENQEKYSDIRVFGSLAYVFGNIFGGYFIEYLGFDITFIISGSFLILTSFIFMLIKPLKINKNEEKEEEKGSIKEVVLNKKFCLYVLFYLGVVTLSSFGDEFLSLYLTNKGITSKEYGLIASVIIVAEVISMFVYSKIGKKIKDKYAYLLIAVVYLLRSLVIALDLPLFIVIPFTCLRGIAWGLVLSVHVNYLRKIVGINNLTKSIFVLALAVSLFQIIGLNISGNIIENFGYNTLYMIISIFILFVIIVTIIYAVITKHKLKDE